MRVIFWFCLALVLFSADYLYLKSRYGQTYTAESLSVPPGGIEKDGRILATGVIHGYRSVPVMSYSGGTVKTIRFGRNSLVRKGDVLIEFDPQWESDKLRESEAALERSQTALLAAENRLADIDQSITARRQTLITLSRSDRVRSEITQALAREMPVRERRLRAVRSAQAQVESLRRRIDLLRKRAASTRVTAPQDGIVISYNVRTNQIVRVPDEPEACVPVLGLADLSKPLVRATLSTVLAGEVTVGQEVVVRSERLPASSRKGMLKVMQPTAPTWPREDLFDLEIELLGGVPFPVTTAISCTVEFRKGEK